MDQKNPSKKYTKLEKVAEGSYGIVYKCRNEQNHQLCAMKKFKTFQGQGIPVSCFRQLNIINRLQSKQILQLFQVYKDKKNVLMITEWMDYSLKQILKNKSIQFNFCKITYHILKSLQLLHEDFIVHRDLKPDNIMINDLQEQKGSLIVKIIDYGQSKEIYSSNCLMTNQVGTLYYRSPQLLLGSQHYSYEVDMWAMGCIFYQLVTKKILFKEKNQLMQLLKILSILDSPKNSIGFSQLIQSKSINLEQIQHQGSMSIQNQFISKEPNPDAIDLLLKLLKIDKNERISCQQALKHPYFAFM